MQKTIIAISRNLADQGPCVMVGRCADFILRDREDCLRVFIHADKGDRIHQLPSAYSRACPDLLCQVGRGVVFRGVSVGLSGPDDVISQEDFVNIVSRKIRGIFQVSIYLSVEEIPLEVNLKDHFSIFLPYSGRERDMVVVEAEYRKKKQVPSHPTTNPVG